MGFNPDLAARDNVVLNGIMLGLTPREARARFDAVIEFAELEDFVDLKLKNYSSGMQVRLAFSVMIQVDADVLLIDEVLAVGDAAFQQKCFDVFYRLKDEGKTILFVTHDMAAVQRFCDRAVLLERGVVRLVGEPERVANHYVEVNFGRDRLADETGGRRGEERFGSGAGRDRRACDSRTSDGERTTTLPHGAACSVNVRIRFNETVENLAVAVLLENELHQPLFATSNEDGGIGIRRNEAGSECGLLGAVREPLRRRPDLRLPVGRGQDDRAAGSPASAWPRRSSRRRGRPAGSSRSRTRCRTSPSSD